MAASSDPVLSTQAEPELTTSVPPKSYTYYHAGSLFNMADLHINALLSRAISRRSNAKYVPVVPQDLEQRDTSPHAIRDQDIRALLSADLALFVYDGTELDSGTVVEFMFAKMADIPAVIVRTDFRGAGDQQQGPAVEEGDQWNLMSSFYPRVERVIVNAMLVYKQGLANALGRNCSSSEASVAAGEQMVEQTADAVVAALDKVSKKPAVLPPELRDSVYQWLAIMPNLRDRGEENIQDMLRLCSEKVAKGLL